MDVEVCEDKGRGMIYVFHHHVGEHFSHFAGDAQLLGVREREAGVGGWQHAGGL